MLFYIDLLVNCAKCLHRYDYLYWALTYLAEETRVALETDALIVFGACTTILTRH